MPHGYDRLLSVGRRHPDILVEPCFLLPRDFLADHTLYYIFSLSLHRFFVRGVFGHYRLLDNETRTIGRAARRYLLLTARYLFVECLAKSFSRMRCVAVPSSNRPEEMVDAGVMSHYVTRGKRQLHKLYIPSQSTMDTSLLNTC